MKDLWDYPALFQKGKGKKFCFEENNHSFPNGTKKHRRWVNTSIEESIIPFLRHREKKKTTYYEENRGF